MTVEVLKPATPAVTSANLPKPPVAAPVVEVSTDAVVAKPLTRTDFTKIKPKNTGIVFRGIFTGHNGLRYEQAKALGFVNATQSDCEAPGWIWRDGGFHYGDLILMKIDAKTYNERIKENVDAANQRVSRAANVDRAKGQLATELRGVGGIPASYRGKIGVFVPTTGDLDKL